jgi:SAM-dependent methyltransferase
MPTELQLENEMLRKPWFYRFRLPSGRTTDSYLHENILAIHETRERMLLAALQETFPNGFGGLRALDLACHEGYFAHHLAKWGFGEIVGVEARRELLERAELMRATYGHSQLRFQQGDVERLDAQALGRFEVVLLFGILYHVENLIGVLRLARAVTTGVCLIETQVAPELMGSIEWGAQGFTRPIQGCLAVVNEADEVAAGNREACLGGISLCPSLHALQWLLRAVGFQSSVVLPPPAGAYEQLARGKRVMVAAYPGA